MRQHKNGRKEFDVIVCGGGPAGFAAALTAARRDAKTLVIEQSNCLGGTATSGLNFGFVSTVGMHSSVHDELYERMSRLEGTRGVYFDPEVYKYVSQAMLEEAGAEMLFHTFAESPVLESQAVKGVNVVNKGGRQSLYSKVVIDVTGDADIAAASGAPVEKGRASDGRMQALTLRSRIGGVGILPRTDWRRINQLLARAAAAGEVKVPEYTVGYLDAGGEGVRGERTFNLDMATGVDATNPWDLSKAEQESRKRVWELLFFVRKNVKGWENAYLIDTGSYIGVRETRRIRGKYVLTREDISACRKFDDGIARCSNWMDLHDPEVFKEKSHAAYIKRTSVPEGNWYEIPYRCLLPERTENLLIAGRCVSSDRATNGSLRIMPTCMATGLAAGAAAALAVSRAVSPEMLTGKEVRNLVKTSGGDL
ncbi:MAG: FAD-dependent oxidoreductase [Victivallaceae bacterium]|nr:FAD-dependent oxidoreductase [Victivallaceae bacterium]